MLGTEAAAVAVPGEDTAPPVPAPAARSAAAAVCLARRLLISLQREGDARTQSRDKMVAVLARVHNHGSDPHLHRDGEPAVKSANVHITNVLSIDT